MRAPDKKFTGYSDAQWRAIHAIGVDWPSARESLEDTASLYTLDWGTPEPHCQRVQRRQKLRAALVAARRALDDPDLGLGWQFAGPRKQARAVLDVVITNIKMPIAQPRTGNKNAKQTHIQYWHMLAEYYEDMQRIHSVPRRVLGRSAGSHQYRPGHSPKQLIAFLHACSRPVFPHKTTLEAVSSFAYRFCKRARV